MKVAKTIRAWRREAGIALLIAIFVLLLISVVAIALIVSSGTESALAGNYRNATAVYYAALAGLEEARGRLSARNSNSFASTAPGFLPLPGTALPNGTPIYIINPAGGEVVAPWDPASLYPDTEFNQEFGSSGFTLPNPSPSTPSLSAVAGIQGPMYKWVRINAVSERSLNLDVAPFDGSLSRLKTVFYDGVQLNDILSGGQVFEITSLAVLPNGSQKLLQYLVAPINLTLSFPAALTMDSGSANVNFVASGNTDFLVNGLDQANGVHCSPVESSKPAVATTNFSAKGQVIGGIPYPTRYPNYIGSGGSPSVNNVGLIPTFQTVSALDNDSAPQGLVQIIRGMADHVLPGNSTLTDLGSPSRMVTTVVNGDLTLGDMVNGYGLLVVTGNLNLSGSASWQGIILVIGQGQLNIPGSGNYPPYGYGKIQGAVLIATTRNPDNSLRVNFGTPVFNTPSVDNGDSGFYYDSCWVKAAIPFGSYKILSFHEVSQP